MTTSSLPLPPCCWTDMAYDCDSRGRAGFSFRLRLAFRDETRNPPASGSFDHEWVVTRRDLDRAERQGRADLLLLERRDREARTFLTTVDRTLRQARARLERVGRQLVLRGEGE